MDTAQEQRKGIFISYRRDDSAGSAGRLSDHLANEFGAELVFLDVVSIVGGDDWRGRIDMALDHCDTMLVVIGKQWLTLRSEAHPGVRRIDEPDDMVAWEIARGLSRGMRVIQVLVQDAVPVEIEQLPPAVAALATRQSMEIRHETFSGDVRELANQIKRSRQSISLFRSDWAESDWSHFAHVRDSGAEGTAGAITIVNALELLLTRAGASKELSARYLYEKARHHQEVAVDSEGLLLQPALFVASFFGVPEEEVWPYRPRDNALPLGHTWDSLEETVGSRYRGDFFRVDGLMDAVRQLAAGRPVIAVFEVKRAWFETPCSETGEIPMPPHDSPMTGLTTGLLTGYQPNHRRFRFMATWGTDWGDTGFGSLTVDVARRVVQPDDLWSVELAGHTVAHLAAARSADEHLNRP
jgi:hypothetical protein